MLNFVIISGHIKEFFIQELEFDRSICMAAICYRGPISIIYPEVVPLPWTTLHYKFDENILSNKTVFIKGFELIGPFVWQRINRFLGRKEHLQNFRFISQKSERLVCVYTDRQTWLNRLSSSCWSYCGVSVIPSAYYKLRDKLNVNRSGYKKHIYSYKVK